jgi:hypothetical protein
LLWLFWRWGLENYLPRLALNCDPPNFNLPSSWDYRWEPLCLASIPFLNRGSSYMCYT